MTKIKTYEEVNQSDEMGSFRCMRMEEVFDKYGTEVDDPHRHNYYTIILVKHAKGVHYIDFNEYQLGDSHIFFVSPGQVHQVMSFDRPSGYVMVFGTDFLLENNIPPSFISDLELFNNYGDSAPISLSQQNLDKLSRYGEEIITWDRSDQKFKEQAIGALLKLLLVDCNNLSGRYEGHPQKRDAGNHIIKNFKTLVEDHHTEWHATSNYAAQLFITPDHLNRTVKALIGKTAKEYIQSRIIIAAKRLLYFTDHTTKEIGFDLGFDEASNFSTFFKKSTGKSPTQFRNIN